MKFFGPLFDETGGEKCWTLFDEIGIRRSFAKSCRPASRRLKLEAAGRSAATAQTTLSTHLSGAGPKSSAVPVALCYRAVGTALARGMRRGSRVCWARVATRSTGSSCDNGSMLGKCTQRCRSVRRSRSIKWSPSRQHCLQTIARLMVPRGQG